MRVNRKRKISKKRCLRTMSILLASMMVVSASGGRIVYAGQSSAKTEISAEQTDERAEDQTVIYLNGKTGRNRNSGKSSEKAVRTFKKAAELAGDYGIIRICGTVRVLKDEIWELPPDVVIRRAEGFEGPLVRVEGSLELNQVRVYQEDIAGDGEVKGAIEEKEKIYIPETFVMSEPKALAELRLIRCEGDGEFVWEDEEYVPSAYETVCKLVFHPKDGSVDYSEEEGWDADKEMIVREVTIRVTSLKLEEDKKDEPEVTPEVTPETKPEVSPEVTPETKPEVSPEVTPETKPEVSPEVTPETKPEVSPEVTPETKPEVSPEVTPETKPEVSPEVTPETKPEVSPEVTPETKPEVSPEVTPETKPEVSPEVTPETKPEVSPEAPDGADQEQKPEEQEKVLTEEEKAAVVQVQNLIDYLPGEVESLEVVEAIVDASRQYEALSKEQKALLTVESADKLSATQKAAAVFNRQCNGVTIEGDFPWYIQFQVELKNEKDDDSLLETNKADTLITPYDMKLWDLMHGVEYKLNGQQVKVTMPAPDNKVYTQLVVVHYAEDGAIEYITPVHNQDGTISFITTSFSPYHIAGTKIAGSNSLIGNTDKVYQNSNKKPLVPSKPSGNKKPSGTSRPSTTGRPASRPSQNTSTWVPLTGDEQNMLLYAGIGAGALVILIVAVFMKNRKKK